MSTFQQPGVPAFRASNRASPATDCGNAGGFAELIGQGGTHHAQQDDRHASDWGRQRPAFPAFRWPRRGSGAAQPLFATTRVEGTENVYIFRYQNHQAMFVVTPAGVIATDPISYGRPQAAKPAIPGKSGKITKAPVKYLIDSHHHYDHIAGGKPFKDAGAVVVAHKRAKERLTALKGLDIEWNVHR